MSRSCPRCGGPGGPEHTYGKTIVCRTCQKAAAIERRRTDTDNPYRERLLSLVITNAGLRPREYASAIGLDTYDHRLRAARDTLVHEGRMVARGATNATRWWPTNRKTGAA